MENIAKKKISISLFISFLVVFCESINSLAYSPSSIKSIAEKTKIDAGKITNVRGEKVVYGSILDKEENKVLMKLPRKQLSTIRKIGKENVYLTISQIAESAGESVNVYFLNPKDSVSISSKVLKIDLFKDLVDISGIKFKPDSLKDGKYKLSLTITEKTLEGIFEYRRPVVIAGSLNISNGNCLGGVNSITDLNGNTLSRLVSLNGCSYLNEVRANKIKIVGTERSEGSSNNNVAISKIITHKGIFYAPVELDATKNGEARYEVNLETTKAVQEMNAADKEQSQRICQDLEKEIKSIEDFTPPCLTDGLKTLCPDVTSEISDSECQRGSETCDLSMDEEDCVDISKVESKASLCTFCEVDEDCSPQISLENENGCNNVVVSCVSTINPESKEVKVCHIRDKALIEPFTCKELPVLSAAAQCLVPSAPQCKISSAGNPKEGFDKRCCSSISLGDRDIYELSNHLRFQKSSEIRYDSDEPKCGNGKKEGTEQCDDGNTNKGDGCNDKCQIEVCGNGIKDEKEDCDDGNNINNDLCSNLCKEAKCGDGIVQPSKEEQCDDGNTNKGDGCSEDCKLELTPLPTPKPSPTATPKPSPSPEPSPTPKPTETPGVITPTTPQVICGNGKLEVGEQCDDGNTNKGDGCDSTCKIEPPQTGTSFSGGTNIPIEACIFKILCSNVEANFAPGEFGKPRENVVEVAIQQCRNLLLGSDRPNSLPPSTPTNTSTYVGGTQPSYPGPEGGISPEFCIFHPKNPICTSRTYERTK